MSRSKWFLCAAGLAALLLLIAKPSHGDPAGANPDARIAMDMREPDPGTSCESLHDAYGSCSDVVLWLDGTGAFDAVVVVYNFTGTTGVQYSLRWPVDWEIDSFTSCSHLLVGGRIEENPMDVYQVWTSPVYSAGGTSGIPVAILHGYAPSPGFLEILGPGQGLAPIIVDTSYRPDPFTGWFDGSVGQPSPYNPCSLPPVADFTVSNPEGQIPLEVSFTDLSYPEPVNWLWTFGDGHTSTEQNPMHVYTDCDTYSVTLQVTNEFSTDDTTQVDAVRASCPEPLIADFTMSPMVGQVPLEVTFTDLTAGHPTSWSWEFGDGAMSTEQNPTHVYTVCDTYSVTLTVTNEFFEDDTTRANAVKVACGHDMVADFDVENPQGVVPLWVYFTDRSVPAPNRWQWNFGDGYGSSEQNPAHLYAACDTYSVKLTVRSDTGIDDTTRVDIVLAACNPDTTPPAGCGRAALIPGVTSGVNFTTNLGGSEPPVFEGHVLSEPTGGFRGLYAPSEADDATFRSYLAIASGGTWDYMDVRLCTPTIEELSQYDCVMTWVNYAYFDNVQFGNVLADYVDRGGDVVLGAFCAYTAGNFLAGRIMDDPAYCPVTGGFNKFFYATWSGDYRSACAHIGVTAYGATYRDILTLRSGAELSGTYTDGNISQATNRWHSVRYANGAGGIPLDGGTQAWAQIVANVCMCSGATNIERSSWGSVKHRFE